MDVKPSRKKEQCKSLPSRRHEKTQGTNEGTTMAMCPPEWQRPVLSPRAGHFEEWFTPQWGQGWMPPPSQNISFPGKTSENAKVPGDKIFWDPIWPTERGTTDAYPLFKEKKCNTRAPKQGNIIDFEEKRRPGWKRPVLLRRPPRRKCQLEL